MINFEKISKNIFCIFVFFFPFFFIPQINVSQVLNEKAFLLVFGLIVFLFQLLNVFFSKKLSLRDTSMQRAMGFFIFALLLSLLFSKNIFLSFWGRPFQADAFIVFLACSMVFYLSSTINRRGVLKVLEFFVSGSAILSILYLIKRFTGINLAVFDSVSGAAIIISMAFVILISFVFNNLNYFRKGSSYNIPKVASMGTFFILFFVSLVLIDFKLSWFFVSIGMFLVFWRSMIESNFIFKRQKSILSLFLLIVFLSLFFLPSPLGEKVNESRLSYESSWSIAENSLKESVKNLFIGSGLSTYSYQFSLYKDKSFNTVDSSLIFKEGSIPLLTFLVTGGMIVVFSLLLLLFLFYYQGFKYFLNYRKERNNSSINVLDLLFPTVFCLSLLIFFYRIDISSLFLFLFTLGLWDSQQKGEERVVNIPSQRFAKICLSVVFIAWAIVIFNFINYYMADVHYQKAINNFNNQGAISESITEMEKAANLWKSSDYDISLSQLYLIKASEDFSQKWTTAEKKEEQKELIKEGATKAEIFAKMACDSDKNNFQSWHNLGLVYENTNFLIDDRTEQAIGAYEKAKSLAPQNYDIYVAIARLLEEDKKNKEALEEYKKAFELNPLDNNVSQKIKELQQ
jgi:tetratricopeptide (TPR) repeat protein